ncbi:helix-turn-helix domain-containing protein [Streptomyces spirodelae]|uniref:Helix-turn-helix domain-containing protein n=1 Tax=Streptomyces spirodelae TaxID=2812904 RepID=A0ABS3X285_9ACTN|nr:helix-turn-helix domain-containing protein [Streptomyces spirodelae]
MGRSDGPLCTENDSVADLARWLREQRQRAQLSYEEMAALTPFSASTLSRAAKGHGVPRQAVVEAYARACDADVRRARNLWRMARREVLQEGPPAFRAFRPEIVSTFADLHTAMLALRQWSGSPSLKELEVRAGDNGELPHSTLHRVLRGESLPHRHHVLAFVRACGESGAAAQQWAAAWDRAQRDTRRETFWWPGRLD